MPDPRHLNNAPITEALIDFQIAPPVKVPSAQMAETHKRIRDSYPAMQERKRFQGEIKIEGGKLVVNTESLGILGYILKTEDERTVVQFRNDGFTLNRLKPYTSWGDLFPEPLRLWDLYVEVSGVQSVARLALRYINHLRLPWSEGDAFSKYLLAPPNVPEPIPQSVSQYLLGSVCYS